MLPLFGRLSSASREVRKRHYNDVRTPTSVITKMAVIEIIVDISGNPPGGKPSSHFARTLIDALSH
jgi:hypothetical protein